MNTSKTYFDHEKLIAYQRSIQFVAWSSPVLEKLPTKLAVSDQSKSKIKSKSRSKREAHEPIFFLLLLLLLLLLLILLWPLLTTS